MAFRCRKVDAALGRFVGVDPKAKATESLSSYNYAGNNPITYNDPNGDFNINPFSPGFNMQVGNGWIEQNGGVSSTSHSGGGGYGGSYSGNYGDVYGGSSSGVSDPGSGGGSNASFYASLNAALTGDPLAIEQYAAANAMRLPDGTLASFVRVRTQRCGTGYGDDITWQGSDVYFTQRSANQEGGPLTHAQELAKYGQVIGGTSLSISVGALRQGFVIEYGSVYTDKNYQIDYKTVYKLSTSATISYSPGGFSVYSKSGYNTTFSDWAGPVTGYSISFLAFTYTREWSTTYNTYGLGVGPSISLPKIGTGAYVTGTTTLIGQPYLAPPVSGD